jgi:hypothetical protein
MSARLGLLLLMLLPAGCIEPNGKQRSLFFGLEFPEGTGVGLSQDVLLPDSKQIGAYRRNFTGTTLEATGDGLRLLENTHLDSGGYRLRVLCDLDSDAQTRELHVKIKNGIFTRYEDRYDLTCYRTSAVHYFPASTGSAPAMLGAEFTIAAALDARDDKNNVVAPLGHGFLVLGSDPAIELVDEEDTDGQMRLGFVALKPSADVHLQAGLVEAQLPLEILDDTAWDIALQVTRSTGSGADGGTGVDGGSTPRLAVSASAKTPDGGFVYQLGPCDFTVTSGAAVLASSTRSNCMDSYVIPDEVTGQVCVSASRHSACAAF